MPKTHMVLWRWPIHSFRDLVFLQKNAPKAFLRNSAKHQTRKIINKEYLKIQQEVRTEFKEMGL